MSAVDLLKQTFTRTHTRTQPHMLTIYYFLSNNYRHSTPVNKRGAAFTVTDECVCVTEFVCVCVCECVTEFVCVCVTECVCE